MMEARKRAASPDSIGPSSKKRIISASDWSKPISVTVQKTEDDEEEGEDIAGDQLERFQKEAIFRRMKHYSRLKDEMSLRVQDLEKRLRRSEAVVGAVEACWNQLVSHAQSLVPTGLPPLEPSALEIYDMSRSFPPPKHDEEPPVSVLFEVQLRKTSQSTQALLAAFAQLAPNAVNPDVQELRTRCSTYSQESAAHKAESAMLRRRVQELEKEVEEAREKVAAAQNRVERVRSETVVLLEAKLGRSLELEQDGVKKEAASPNGVGPTPTGLNGVKHEPSMDAEDDTWHAIAEKREKAIETLTAENRKLTEEVTSLRVELQNPSDQTVAETVYFKRLLAKLGDLQAAAAESKEEAAKATKDLEDFKVLRLEFETLLEAQAQAKIEEMKGQVEKLQADNNRLRSSAKSEAEARQLYADAKEQLEKYERVYGSTSGSASGSESENHKLLRLVAEKDEALRSFKALKREEDERIHGQPTAMDDLCRQIEDLIATKEKEAANIAALEAKINKAVVEKSKADNKYYAAMRQKDTIEAERNSLATHRERQATRIEQMQAQEQSLRQQVLTLDKVVAASNQDLIHVKQDMARLEDEMHFMAMTSEGHQRRIVELEKELKERQDLADNRRHQLRKLEEEVIRLKKDVTKAEYQAEHLVPRSGSPSELTKTNENLL
ncbi:E3 ubiquitin-protein ligase bre1, partial [Tulasnella sp. 417]